jgi:hypothetical protein
MICPNCGRARLIVYCTQQAATALAGGQEEWADGWADLAARIRGDDDFNDPDDHEEATR